MAVSAIKKDATAKPNEPAAAAEQKAPPKARKRNWVVLLGVLFGLCGAGGGAFWYASQDGTAAHAKPVAAKPPLFLPLETFTVNLKLEENPQYLRVGITLKVADSAAVDALKLHMPEVRDRVLLLLSARNASELLTLAGKEKLANDIVAAINPLLTPAAPQAPQPAPAETSAPVQAAGAAPDADAAQAPSASTGAPVLNAFFTSFIIQ